MAVPIKIIPTTANVVAFTGTDSEYTARKFIAQCEDVMNNSYITEPGDKISFVRSKLQPGSQAHYLMESSTFTIPTENQDYESFKINFLETFDDCAKTDVVKSVNSVCERLGKSVFTKGRLDGQVVATQTASDLMRILKENSWVDHDNITTKDLHKFLEFFSYMLVLRDEERKASLSLDYKRENRMHDFSNKLKTKLEESAMDVHYPASKVASTQQIAAATNGKDLDLEETTSYANAVKNMAVVLTCHYCSKPGHTANRCYAKFKDRKRLKRTIPADFCARPPSSQSSASFKSEGTTSSGDGSVRPKRPALAERLQTAEGTKGKCSTPSPYSTSKYCSVHNSSTHSTDECHAIGVLREKIQKHARANSTPQSGEASRTDQTQPG